MCEGLLEFAVLFLKSLAVVLITVFVTYPFAEVSMIAATEFVAHRALVLVRQVVEPPLAGVSHI